MFESGRLQAEWNRCIAVFYGLTRSFKNFMLRIIIAEDHAIVRKGLRMLCEALAEVMVVAEYSNGEDVLDYLAQGGEADILLTDIHMSGMGGLSLTKRISELHPLVKVIVLTMLSDDEYVNEAFINGARGYLLKTIDNEQMAFAIRIVAGGERYLCTELVERLLSVRLEAMRIKPHVAAQKNNLSEREVEVLKLVAEGYTNNEIAERLFISKRTVEGHRQALLEKTGTKNTATLIRYALVSGIV